MQTTISAKQASTAITRKQLLKTTAPLALTCPGLVLKYLLIASRASQASSVPPLLVVSPHLSPALLDITARKELLPHQIIAQLDLIVLQKPRKRLHVPGV